MDSSERRFRKAAYKAAKDEPRRRAWYVYEDYEFEVYGNEAFILASESSPAQLYTPLEDHTDLFLKFARLAPKGGGHIPIEAMFDWAEKYGLLGAAHGDVLLNLLPRERAVNVGEGRAESLSHFSQCVWEAARTLALYEALKAPGGSDVKTLVKMYHRGERMSPEKLEEEALSEVWRRVQRYLETGSYLMPYELEDGSFVEGPGFHSLLGAMWIKMWWILKAGDNFTRCFRPDCFKIIDYESPSTTYQGPAAKKKTYKRGPYKSRIDKYFCRKGCYELWRYHEKKAGRSGKLSDALTNS